MGIGLSFPISRVIPLSPTLNVPSFLCSLISKPCHAEKVNPLPYHCNNVVIGSHNEDLASRGAALHGEGWNIDTRREGLGVINELTQEICL